MIKSSSLTLGETFSECISDLPKLTDRADKWSHNDSKSDIHLDINTWLFSHFIMCCLLTSDKNGIFAIPKWNEYIDYINTTLHKSSL